MKVKDDSKKAGTQKPEPELMEVYDGISALQGTDTLEMLGTPATPTLTLGMRLVLIGW